MLGDTAYDGHGLREERDWRGTKPNHPNRRHLHSFNKRVYNCAGGSKARSTG